MTSSVVVVRFAVPTWKLTSPLKDVWSLKHRPNCTAHTDTRGRATVSGALVWQSCLSHFLAVEIRSQYVYIPRFPMSTKGRKIELPHITGVVETPKSQSAQDLRPSFPLCCSGFVAMSSLGITSTSFHRTVNTEPPGSSDNYAIKVLAHQ